MGFATFKSTIDFQRLGFPLDVMVRKGSACLVTGGKSFIRLHEVLGVVCRVQVCAPSVNLGQRKYWGEKTRVP